MSLVFIKRESEIPEHNSWNKYKCFKSCGKIIDSNGKKIKTLYSGKKYQIIEKHIYNYNCIEKAFRAIAGVIVFVATLGLADIKGFFRNRVSRSYAIKIRGKLLPPIKPLVKMVKPSEIKQQTDNADCAKELSINGKSEMPYESDFNIMPYFEDVSSESSSQERSMSVDDLNMDFSMIDEESVSDTFNSIHRDSSEINAFINKAKESKSTDLELEKFYTQNGISSGSEQLSLSQDVFKQFNRKEKAFIEVYQKVFSKDGSCREELESRYIIRMSQVIDAVLETINASIKKLSQYKDLSMQMQRSVLLNTNIKPFCLYEVLSSNNKLWLVQILDTLVSSGAIHSYKISGKGVLVQA